MVRIVTLDIEVSTVPVHTWGCGWKVKVGPQQIIQDQFMLGFSWKWLDEKKTHNMFMHSLPDEEFMSHDHTAIIKKMWEVLDEADIVITYNGDSFDLAKFNGYCLALGLKPPSKYKSVDLFKTVKRKFNIESKRLDYVNKLLGYQGKDEMCYQDWLDCWMNDIPAYKKMAKYCDRDVVALEEAYKNLLAWIDNHPNLSQISGETCCPKCGSKDYAENGGWTIPNLHGFRRRRHICKECECHFVNPNIKEKVREDKAMVQER